MATQLLRPVIDLQCRFVFAIVRMLHGMFRSPGSIQVLFEQPMNGIGIRAECTSMVEMIAVRLTPRICGWIDLFRRDGLSLCDVHLAARGPANNRRCYWSSSDLNQNVTAQQVALTQQSVTYFIVWMLLSIYGCTSITNWRITNPWVLIHPRIPKESQRIVNTYEEAAEQNYYSSKQSKTIVNSSEDTSKKCFTFPIQAKMSKHNVYFF